MASQNPEPSCRPVIDKPLPFKGVNIRILIVIPITDRGLLIRGLHYPSWLTSWGCRFFGLGALGRSGGGGGGGGVAGDWKSGGYPLFSRS